MDPIRTQRTTTTRSSARHRLARPGAPGVRAAIIGGAIALAKWTFVLVKFGSIFIAVGGYALIWGWKFAVGLVLLILRARARALHRGEARGAEPAAADVHAVPRRLRPVHARQPVADRAGRAGRADARRRSRRSASTSSAAANGSALLQALAYFGFFLNLMNMIPCRSSTAARSGARRLAPPRRRRREGDSWSTSLYFATVAAARRSAWSRRTSPSTASRATW